MATELDRLAEPAAEYLFRRFVLSAEERKKLEERDRKKAKARAERQKVYRQRVADAERGIGKVDRYIFGDTGELIIANRDRIARQRRINVRKQFRQEYAEEIESQMAYVARRYKWYQYSDDLDDAIRAKAEREAWREHGEDFMDELDSDFFDSLKGDD